LIRCLVSIFVALLLAAQASAGVSRPIPEGAPKATMQISGGSVLLAGKRVRLSPGAQIRDTANRIVLPSHLSGSYLVRVVIDGTGQLHRVWILSPEEAAKPAPKL
jgi:hypothetical protein